MLTTVEGFVEFPLDGWVYDAATESVPMMRPTMAKFEGGKAAPEMRGPIHVEFTRYYDPEAPTTLSSSFDVSPARESLQLISS